MMIGIVIKFLIDRIGARPIYVMCTAASIFGLVCTIFPATLLSGSAQGSTTAPLIIFLLFVFFIVNFTLYGTEGVGQTYFFNLVPEKYMMDMSIVYYFVYAAAGAGGTFFAGFILDSLRLLGMSYFAAFRTLFIICALILAIVLFLQRRLVSLGAISTLNAIGLIFSLRDLRAIALLDKLDKSDNPDEEEELLEELSDTSSLFAVPSLLEKMSSPRFTVRIEALNALSNMNSLDSQCVSVLLNDISKNQYTTAYLSTRILGKHKVANAIPVLRAALDSKDHILSGEAMIALARCGDSVIYPHISELVYKTENPRLKIMGFEAISITHSFDFMPVLVDCFLAEEMAEHVKDEAALSLASILGCASRYYKSLTKLLHDGSFPLIARDAAEEAFEAYRARRDRTRHSDTDDEQALKHDLLARDFSSIVDDYVNSGDTVHFAQWMLRVPSRHCGMAVKLVLSSAVMEVRLSEQDRFRLLAVLWCCAQLRTLGSQ
jgi:hypothetical protein